MKISVLQITHSMNLGGGARAIRTIYKYSPKDVDIHVITTHEEGPRFSEFKKTCKNLYFANKSVSFIDSYVKKNKIQIVHFHGAGIFNSFEKKIARKVKKNGVKIIYTNIFGHYDNETDNLVDFYTFKSKHALSQIFTKNSGINILAQPNCISRYRVIPNPVDFKYFENIKPTNLEIETYRNSLGISAKHLVIGKVGARKAVEKWSDLLLYMFPLVLRKNKNVVMVLQGVPDSRLKWVEKFKGKIIVLPETLDDKELALMYNILDIFTHASKIGEHSGNSINEAEYWGKPVIVNLTPKKDNGQLEQLVSAKNGYFASTPFAYSRKVLELLESKKRRMRFGKAGKQIIQYNRADLIINDFVRVYKTVLYNKVYPGTISLEDIAAYNKDYLRSTTFLESSTFLDKVCYKLVYFPSIIFWKIHDYIEHNFFYEKTGTKDT